MDHQRRLLLFGLSCFLILTGWLAVGPVLFPGMFPEPKPKDQLEKLSKKNSSYQLRPTACFVDCPRIANETFSYKRG